MALPRIVAVVAVVLLLCLHCTVASKSAGTHRAKHARKHDAAHASRRYSYT